ncbi:MAG TPA: TetR/AcrR family transcriptional regulator [Stellaceae bacterium]|nr:TetR/AcrR family transcriptional regulator [Stellaceae bacterium]
MAYRRTDEITSRLAEKRGEIIEAARRIVAERGFREAQIAAIATAAGVATGTVYRYFPSKADLFTEVLAATSEREVTVAASIAATEGSAAQRLADAAHAFASRAVRGRRLAYALIAEPVDPEIDKARLDYRRALGRVFEGLIEEGVRRGEFPRQNVAASAACVVGALIEGLVSPLAPDADRIEDGGATLAEAIATFCVRAVAGQASHEARSSATTKVAMLGDAVGRR